MRVALIIVALVAVSQVSAISIKWTGYASNNQWSTNTNWYPDKVPGPNDDVTIDSGIVLCTVSTGVNSLVMGTQIDEPANLTLFQDFYVGNGGMNVAGNGNLMITAGTSFVTGTVAIGGNLYFSSGAISGQWTITKRGNAFLGAGGKTLTGCSFNADGPVDITGLLTLNESSIFTTTSTVDSWGTFLIQAQDQSPVLFDASQGTLTYEGGGTLYIQALVKLGTFYFKSGNLSVSAPLTFVNSFDIPKGSFIDLIGDSAVNMSAGVTGAGVLDASGKSLVLSTANMTGTMNLISGTVQFLDASHIETMIINGGTYTGSSTVGSLSLMDGNLIGEIAALNGYINSKGFDLYGALAFSGKVTTAADTILAFQQAGKLSLSPAAVMTIGGTGFTFTGPPGTGGFQNFGTVIVNSVATFQSTDVAGTGMFNVSGKVSLTAMKFQQSSVGLSGHGTFTGMNSELIVAKVLGSPAVQAVIEKYSLMCPMECDNVKTLASPTAVFTFSL